jgi:hypothetical protein
VEPGRAARPLTCLKTLFEQGASSGGAITTVSGEGVLAFPKLAPRSAAYRITFVTKSGSQALNGVVDVALLGRGRIDTVMLFVGFGTPNATRERHLAGVAASRM